MWFSLTLLSAFLWGAINVGNSTIAAKYKRSPSAQLWIQSLMSGLLLVLTALFFDISTSWMPWLFAAAAVSYLGDLVFLRILSLLDVTVVNAAWAILAVFLSIIGFVFFQETWTSMQMAGALLVILGIIVLTFFNRHGSLIRTVGLLSFLALLYVPGYALRKASLLDDQSLVAVVFWLLAGREFFGVLVPLVIPKLRNEVLRTLREPTNVSFLILSGLVVGSFYIAEFALSRAYVLGPVSLISVTANVQPFFVIALSALLARFLPLYAAKEAFSMRGTSVKIGSFLIVFLGLALLALSA